jgi:hypothetical protein
MKLPGRAWLQFEVQPIDAHTTRLVQTAFFDPSGLLGLLYWYVLYPIHGVIFAAMSKRIAETAEQYARYRE